MLISVLKCIVYFCWIRLSWIFSTVSGMFILVIVFELSFLEFWGRQAVVFIRVIEGLLISLLLFDWCQFGLGKCSNLFSIRNLKLFVEELLAMFTLVALCLMMKLTCVHPVVFVAILKHSMLCPLVIGICYLYKSIS